MPGRPSRLLDALPQGILEERRTSGVFGGELLRRKAGAAWRAGTLAAGPAPEIESQDAPRYVKGERVRHRKFGSGTIRGLAGFGRDLKVLVEFDDAAVGSKQLLVAYAALERDWDAG